MVVWAFFFFFFLFFKKKASIRVSYACCNLPPLTTTGFKRGEKLPFSLFSCTCHVSGFRGDTPPIRKQLRARRQHDTTWVRSPSAILHCRVSTPGLPLRYHPSLGNASLWARYSSEASHKDINPSIRPIFFSIIPASNLCSLNPSSGRPGNEKEEKKNTPLG